MTVHIVTFSVRSSYHGIVCKVLTLHRLYYLPLPADGVEVLFTYEVSWKPSTLQWASRWDTYLTMTDVQIHWFSIVNSVVVVFFLSGN